MNTLNYLLKSKQTKTTLISALIALALVFSAESVFAARSVSLAPPDQPGPYDVGFLDSRLNENGVLEGMFCYEDKLDPDLVGDSLGNTGLCPEENLPGNQNKIFRPVSAKIWYPTEKNAAGELISAYDSNNAVYNIQTLEDAYFSKNDPAQNLLSYKPKTTLTVKKGAPIGSLKSRQKFPLLTYSHGYIDMDTSAVATVEFLASHGFIVVSIGHTNDHGVAYGLDGFKGVKDNPLSTIQYNGDYLPPRPVAMRMTDIQETISWMLKRAETSGDLFNGKIDDQKIGSFGWSYGGLGSIGASAGVGNYGVMPDTRIKAVINFDGSVFFPENSLHYDEDTGVYNEPGIFLSDMKNFSVPYMVFGSKKRIPEFTLIPNERKYAVIIPQIHHWMFGGYSLQVESLLQDPTTKATLDYACCKWRPVKLAYNYLSEDLLTDPDLNEDALYNFLLSYSEPPMFPYSMPLKMSSEAFDTILHRYVVAFMKAYVLGNQQYLAILSPTYPEKEPYIIFNDGTGLFVPDHPLDIEPGTKISFFPVGASDSRLFNVTYQVDPINNVLRTSTNNQVPRSYGHPLVINDYTDGVDANFGGEVILEGGEAFVDLPFRNGFRFLGESFDTIKVADDGFITLGKDKSFDRLHGDPSGTGLTASGMFNIAAYMSDLSPVKHTGNVASQIRYNALSGPECRLEGSDRCVVVTWDRIEKRDYPSTIRDPQGNVLARGFLDYDSLYPPVREPRDSTFQIILHEDGRIEFIYDELDDIAEFGQGIIATIGISAGDHQKVLSTGFGSPPTNTEHVINDIDYSALPEDGRVFSVGTIMEVFSQPVCSRVTFDNQNNPVNPCDD